MIAQTGMAAALVLVLMRESRRNDVTLRAHPGRILGAARTGIPLLIRTLALRAVLLVYQGTMRFQAGIAQPPLGPDAADRLDTLAAVPGVVACGVTVALEPQRRVAAVKEELLQVAHADGYRWF